MIYRKSKVEQLSEAFAPCTVAGLADEVWKINLEIGELRKRRDHLEEIVLNHCMKTGEEVKGEFAPPCRAIDYVAEIKLNGEPVWKWRLEFDKEGRDARRKAL